MGGTPPLNRIFFSEKGVTDLGGTPLPPFTDKIRKVVFDGLTKGRVQKPQSQLFAVMGGGGDPPFPANFFPLTFWPAAFRDGARGGGGGVPPSRTFSVTGVFEHFPKLVP